MLLSFERPARRRRLRTSVLRLRVRAALFPDLENCTVANVLGITGRAARLTRDHRQDIKGTWWMPWHQESKKGVNGCDKPR